MDENVLVSPEWLEARLGESGIRVVDVRDPWEFEGIGHVPGAVNIPFDRFRDDGDEDAGTLPGADAFASLLGEAGISEDDTLVAYDDTHGVFAARFLLTAYVYGHESLHLLDGDYSRWARGYETTTEPTDVDPVEYRPDPLGPEESPIIDRDAVEAAIGTDAVLVDTREEWEFEEERLPGAVRFDWQEAIDPDTRGIKPREELRELLAGREITPDRRIVLYCNTARRISHTYLVLRWLGYPDVDFYEGSLTEWLAEGKAVESDEPPE